MSQQAMSSASLSSNVPTVATSETERTTEAGPLWRGAKPSEKEESTEGTETKA